MDGSDMDGSECVTYDANALPIAVMTQPAPPAPVALDPTNAIELFGSFFLGSDEFALSANCIREVVNFPAKITAVPLAPHFLVGIFTLRGTVIPVLNLGRIFDSAAPPADASQKIAIVEHQQVQVGILFHSTGEILRVRSEQRSSLQYRDTTTHGVVAGTIRLDDGARLVQILDPDALIHIENVPQVLALKSASRAVQTNHFHLQAERRQCVSFQVGGTSFAFEMNAIREIIEVPELKQSALTSKLCLGRINLRGRAVAVIDFSRLLNFTTADSGKRIEQRAQERIVIARIGDASIGLLVDSVDNIFSFYPGDIMPIPLLSKARAGMFGGCISKEGIGEVFYLNHEAIFSGAEIQEITRGHSELYQEEAAADTNHVKKDRTSHQRKVYITFGLGRPCAVRINLIREIIDFSSDLIKPPGTPAFIHGILNLRRQMITIVDLRTLYGMEPLADASGAKVLVIERGAERFGLMVDSVENIVTVTDSDRLPTPQIMRGITADSMRSEMQEVIDMPGTGDGRQTLSVFDIDIFLTRLEREMAVA